MSAAKRQPVSAMVTRSDSMLPPVFVAPQPAERRQATKAREERFRKFAFSNPASPTLSKKRLVINSYSLRRPDFAHVREQSVPKRRSTGALQDASE
jgi:hypothetical protein